jgi:ATP-dependent protease HslVU (ClpYQ) peptidase subunit
MTTIALNKKQIAGDLQMTHSNGITFKSSSKLYTFENKLIYPKPFVVGFCGDVDTAIHIMDFFVDPANYKAPKKMRDCEFVALTADHKMYTFSNPQKWIPLAGKFYALGSGSHFAMGAMVAGCTPEEAVRAAIKLDKSSGYGVSKVEF